MNSTLVGYFPKRRVTRSKWVSPYPEYPNAEFPAPVPVEEICSVSTCIAGTPNTLMSEVPFNEYGGYDTLASAWLAVAPDLRQQFDLYAYRLAPALFRDGQQEFLEVPENNLEPLPCTFACLGYDAVELTHSYYCWGCSPLSCNDMAEKVAVNRYCLVTTEQEGMDMARAFSVSKPEPGPYCLVEVWRDSDPAPVPGNVCPNDN